MNSVEERLQALMAKGYDINIECKGMGRSYSMSYEASVKRSAPKPNDKSGFSWLVVQSHAVGNTLNELIDKLEENLSEFTKQVEATKCTYCNGSGLVQIAPNVRGVKACSSCKGKGVINLGVREPYEGDELNDRH
ncbi:hypothetical protein FZC83_01740 [Rossellomorea marisflavi]|uniref:Uncharacterized protein n=1 Tax=Rossellomorea marisflavi TaxID=189381 RepID=A0A5D4RYA2_9BACI|nr:hypothetical protein [Rossellomorea marisflavi]TYS56317.1 hypothetical protein FZC83_01740 [Rossellomorea marisflavi]